MKRKLFSRKDNYPSWEVIIEIYTVMKIWITWRNETIFHEKHNIEQWSSNKN